MNQKTENLYEGMYLISAKLGDDMRHKAFDKLKKGIVSRGGEILKIHEQGRRRLAYEINGHREGYYYLFYFNIKPAAITELWQEYHLQEELLRFITLRTETVMEKIEFKSLGEQQ